MGISTPKNDMSAKVYQHPKSPYYQAWFLIWDAKKQTWKPITKSTRCRDEAKALEIAREYERVALAAGGPSAGTRLSRDFAVRVINDIMRLAGHREIEDVRVWKEYVAAWMASAKKRLGESTYKSYRSRLNRFNTWLGKDVALPLGSISGEMLQSWYQDGRDSGLSTSSMNGTATLLHSIFERAKDEGFTLRNPVNLLDRDMQECNKRDTFTPADMEALLTYLRADPKRQDWLTVALLGLCTSQRLGDCAKATRGQFVQGKPFWIWEVQQGKTKKKLRIPIVEPLASHLERLWSQPTDSVFLAPSLAATTPDGSAGLSSQFNAILKAAGIQGRKIEGKGKRGRSFHSKTFHSTRHTCNSLLANAGVPPELRKMITGHSDDATNLIYTHFEDTKKAKALSKAFAPKKQKQG